MKKSIVMCAGVCAALVLASCGSSKDSAFKKAYDKAKAQEQVATQPETPAPVVAPIVEKPATQSTVIDNVDNANVRTEDVTLVSGAGLQNFSVVVGSFSLKANAEGLQSTLKVLDMMHRLYSTLLVACIAWLPALMQTRLLPYRAAISSAQATILTLGYFSRSKG